MPTLVYTNLEFPFYTCSNNIFLYFRTPLFPGAYLTLETDTITGLVSMEGKLYNKKRGFVNCLLPILFLCLNKLITYNRRDSNTSHTQQLSMRYVNFFCIEIKAILVHLNILCIAIKF